MALQYKVVKFATPAAAGGTTSVTGVGFTPKLAIIYGVRTSGTQGLAAAFRIGVDDGTNRYSKAVNPGLFSGSHVSDGWMDNAHSILAMRTQGLNELMVEAYIQSFDADGITIKWDFILVATGVEFYALLLGGTGISTKVIGWQPNTSPYSTTAVGFLPTGLFGFRLGSTFDNVLQAGEGQIGFGFSGAACGQATLAANYQSFPAGGVVNSWGYQSDTEWLSSILSTTGAVDASKSVTSLDANGFTVTQTGGGTHGVAAINGCAINVGTLTQPTTTGIQAVPITAGDGKVLILWSHGKVAGSPPQADFMVSFGVGYDPSEQMSVWTGALAGSTSERADCQQDDTHIGVVYTPTANFASTLNTRVSFVDFTNGQFRLNWDTVDGVAREWGYAVLATASASACGAIATGTINVIKNTTPIPGGSTVFTFTTTGLTPSTFDLLDGESRLFSGLSSGTYGVTEVPLANWATTYSVSNGDPHDALVISGNSITVTVLNTFQTQPIASNQLRRLRRWQLPYDGNKKIFIPRIEIIAQMGVGNSSDPTPIMRLRISPDGGETWGPYRDMPFGPAGSTMIRAYLTRFCQGIRNPVAELICDAPVFVAWVACELPQDFTVGTS